MRFKNLEIHWKETLLNAESEICYKDILVAYSDRLICDIVYSNKMLKQPNMMPINIIILLSAQKVVGSIPRKHV